MLYEVITSEEDSGAAQIAPLTFKGPPETAWKMLKETIRDMGGEVQQEENVYLRAIFTSRLFRFVDDVEFRMDTAARITSYNVCYTKLLRIGFIETHFHGLSTMGLQAHFILADQHIFRFCQLFFSDFFFLNHIKFLP